jgi:hypothetical protein
VTEDDVVRLCEKVTAFWPSAKFNPESVQLWARSLERYEYRDAVRVLEWKAQTSRFAPRLAELLGELRGRGKAQSSSGDGYAAAIRSSSGITGDDDAEVICRHQRMLFARHIESLHPDDQRRATRRASMRQQLIAALVSAGYARDSAIGVDGDMERVADGVLSDDPGDFGATMDWLKAHGLPRVSPDPQTGEVVQL